MLHEVGTRETQQQRDDAQLRARARPSRGCPTRVSIDDTRLQVSNLDGGWIGLVCAEPQAELVEQAERLVIPGSNLSRSRQTPSVPRNPIALVCQGTHVVVGILKDITTTKASWTLSPSIATVSISSAVDVQYIGNRSMAERREDGKTGRRVYLLCEWSLL